MLAAMKGTIRGNTVILEDDDISVYDGASVVVTVLDKPRKNNLKKMSTEEINAFIEKHGQPKLLLGDVGLEVVRETLKNDMW